MAPSTTRIISRRTSQLPQMYHHYATSASKITSTLQICPSPKQWVFQPLIPLFPLIQFSLIFQLLSLNGCSSKSPKMTPFFWVSSRYFFEFVFVFLHMLILQKTSINLSHSFLWSGFCRVSSVLPFQLALLLLSPVLGICSQSCIRSKLDSLWEYLPNSVGGQPPGAP